MLRFQIPIVLALMVPATLGAQREPLVDTVQLDSLGAHLSAEAQRLALLSFQTPMSDVVRTQIGVYHNSAREGMAIDDRLRFIATLRGESRDNASLTGKLLTEAAALNRQSVTLSHVIHDQAPGSVIDQLLSALVLQAAAVERAMGARADTVIMLGSRDVDMTGDGRAETLQLVAAGPSVDDLTITFSILSSFDLLYTAELRPFVSDGPKPKLTPGQQMERLSRFGAEFLDDRKFTTPAGFLAMLGRNGPSYVAEIPAVIARDRAAGKGTTPDMLGARAIWSEIRSAQLPVFEFATGGDATTAIAWSKGDARFYRLFECC